MTHKYTNYQLKETEGNHYKRFSDLDFVNKYYGGVNLNDYDKVYEGEYTPETMKSVLDVLELLFHVFNCKHPIDFRGHSLSVSDIVELNGTQYYCDSVGWKTIS